MAKPTQSTGDEAPKKKSRWQKLKEENEERKKNNIQRISAKEATERTGYDETGKPATEWRKEQHAKWVEEQKEDNLKFGVAVASALAPGAAKGAAADGCVVM
ncbi:hypothetical protein DPSP01_002002 [Paraphaeosphaeria sporulosa]|uniref:Uncharacterized protein n=1 Tax=Paraphaeosphaeria sporulosa TaxID=1460663 RepID=A0A177D0Q1_9PLEO|nr:uncharacterized protein CC84DRAFT_1159839 [Paraphaeosphaeria sporulosa]OAG12549.1 hypothetical protein CC84DRAFT_1159839 [Paraphaeosphaeria sporulosa]